MDEHGEIIIYQAEDGLAKIDVRVEDETVWLTQAQLCELYQTSKSNVSEHIKHIFDEGELEEKAVVRNFRTTAADGKNYNVAHYNLDMIISLGYRVKSLIATQFRRWATERLKEYMIKGFTLDDERLKGNGRGNYWKELLERIPRHPLVGKGTLPSGVVDKAILPFALFLHRFPTPYDHAKHRVDVQHRRRDAEPAVSIAERHDQRKHRGQGGELCEVTDARAVALMGKKTDEKEKDVVGEERRDKKDILCRVRHLWLAHELQRHGDVVQRNDKNDVDVHIHRAGGGAFAVDDVVVEYAVAQKQSADDQKRHQRKVDGVDAEEVSPSVDTAREAEQTDGQDEEAELTGILDACELSYFTPETARVFENAIERLFYSESLRIGNATLPQKRVRSRLRELDNMILREAASKLASNLDKPVKNSTAYTMVTIFNAICESESDLMVDPYLNSIGAPLGA